MCAAFSSSTAVLCSIAASCVLSQPELMWRQAVANIQCCGGLLPLSDSKTCGATVTGTSLFDTSSHVIILLVWSACGSELKCRLQHMQQVDRSCAEQAH